ncbi:MULTISPECIES: hypothetical protein [Virgibacillus]|uniref:hypothetical protein n=1 Tax=Virgibacillus TaxID=84406 RepID=UPI0002F4560A|nr:MULTISPECIES: hypothetical protein [Virgibacillus]AIF45310.1 hypothetical protein X953_06885 [Virgibacillus sp. SK37]MYL56766.1 hypothetical protein [Virgibacillus halodenitrificans]
MEVIIIFIAGFIVFIIAIFSVIRMATTRVTAPTEDLKEEVTNLKDRIDELENNKKNNT